MSTFASEELKALASDWAKIYRSARVSGILPDAAHIRRGGYHVSRRDNPDGNYSIVRPDDKSGPDNMAAAIDMTMNAADMRTCTLRLVEAYKNPADPRRKYINAFNGFLGSGSAQRWDVYARKTKTASADHKWHVHLEVRRKYVVSATAMRAILSLLRGQSLADYLGSIKGVRQSAGRASVPPFPGILKRDDSATKPDPNVRLLQQQLVKRGLTSIGSADGYFGAKLEAGVKAWQKRQGLDADGVVGAKTWPTVFAA